VDDPAGGTAAAVARDSWTRLLAVTARVLGDLDLAEDALAEAFAAALERWPVDGIPANPEGWLVATARRRAIDQIRRGRRYAEKLRLLAATLDDGPGDAPSSIPDERLRLVFTCCHPALARDGQVALALRYLCGLRTGEIARLFLVPEATMAARLTRAKKKIAAAGIPYQVPRDDQLPERLAGVLAVLYLVFSEGYAATGGASPIRAELCDRAVGMARLVAALLPDQPEASGLLALVLLQDSRRDARLDPAGRLVLLPEQDRRRWDLGKIRDGLAALDAALRGGTAGPYTIQASIAAEHARAGRPAGTDWAAIVRWYDALAAVAPSPVVALNRAVAVAMAAGPAAGLALLDGLRDEPALRGNHLLPGARGGLLRRLGRDTEADAAYAEAAVLARTGAERDFYRRAGAMS
jgi:RNA polymerase sigma-70 factor (ECF subfamily)